MVFHILEADLTRWMVEEFWVREAGVWDLDSVVELNALLFREDSGRRDSFVDQGWPEREGREHFERFLGWDPSLCLVAGVDAEIVGYLAGYVREGSSLRPVKVAELESMYVREEHRGRGAGARLVGEFIGWSRGEGVGLVSVTAHAANERAIRFYERSGFRSLSLSLEMDLGPDEE